MDACASSVVVVITALLSMGWQPPISSWNMRINIGGTSESAARCTFPDKAREANPARPKSRVAQHRELAMLDTQ